MNEADDLFGDIGRQFSRGSFEQRFGDCWRTGKHSSVVEREAEELRSIHIEARVARSGPRKCRRCAAAPEIYPLAKMAATHERRVYACTRAHRAKCRSSQCWQRCLAH